MEKSLAEYISDALAAARREQNTRENSLVTTKLEEAMMWHTSHQQRLLEAARRIGFSVPAQQEQQSGSNTPPTNP